MRISLLGAGGEGLKRGRRLQVEVPEERAIVDVGKQVFVKIIITQNRKYTLTFRCFLRSGPTWRTSSLESWCWRPHTMRQPTSMLNGRININKLFLRKQCFPGNTLAKRLSLTVRFGRRRSLYSNSCSGESGIIFFPKSLRYKITIPLYKVLGPPSWILWVFFLCFGGNTLFFANFPVPDSPELFWFMHGIGQTHHSVPDGLKEVAEFLQNSRYKYYHSSQNFFNYYLQGTWWCSTSTPSRRSGPRRLTPGFSRFWTVPWVGGGLIQRTDGVRPWKGCGKDKGCRRGRGGSWQCTR